MNPAVAAAAPERQAFYAQIGAHNMAPLWESLHALVTPTPQTPNGQNIYPSIVKADPQAGVIDAYDKSFWFGFADDVAIRVTATDNGSRVDIRSGSRQGRGDFGVNAARVRGFLTALKTQP